VVIAVAIVTVATAVIAATVGDQELIVRLRADRFVTA
jgi:hypothetical protein